MKPQRNSETRICLTLSLCLALSVGGALAQGAPSADKASAASDGNAAPATNAPAFKNEKDKLSYALGVNAASQLRARSVEVDPDLYAQGFKAHLSGGEALLTGPQASAIVGVFQTQLAKKEKAEKTRTARERGEKNKKEGAAFLAENKSKDGVVTLASGVQYKVLKAGDGKKPTPADTVLCNFRGTLVDGTEFSNTVKPATVPVKKVIKGWREVLPLMPVGSKWQVVIPSNLAYGSRGTGRLVGPNATLVFELELLSIKEGIQAPVIEDNPEPMTEELSVEPGNAPLDPVGKDDPEPRSAVSELSQKK